MKKWRLGQLKKSAGGGALLLGCLSLIGVGFSGYEISEGANAFTSTKIDTSIGSVDIGETFDLSKHVSGWSFSMTPLNKTYGFYDGEKFSNNASLAVKCELAINENSTDDFYNYYMNSLNDPGSFSLYLRLEITDSSELIDFTTSLGTTRVTYRYFYNNIYSGYTNVIDESFSETTKTLIDRKINITNVASTISTWSKIDLTATYNLTFTTTDYSALYDALYGANYKATLYLAETYENENKI